MLEERLTMGVKLPAEITSHLESHVDHSAVHQVQRYRDDLTNSL